MLFRDPSVSDVVANALGALLGSAIARRWKVYPIELRIARWIGFAAAMFASGVVFWVWPGSKTSLSGNGRLRGVGW